ncbi:Ger(x)C family spore germination protein [Paenibacillus roseipurpureus]|uniref:Ger(X)C family spore germination protein n=1 Tax=Paenibacillus roseopurpureus TaxID=2918901 RepID=A0AA96LN92_9BACL|nr:Ger(x)C family spore germination protein [Paenibacillus sp. MBLB1832]WNR44144.1 Ger(x)C family spore germination protein [Paenibacillus sp. MBLB1832]
MLIKQVVILLLLPLILTGCWNRKELDQISITTAVGIDKIDDSYNVSVQLLNSDEIASSKGMGQRLPIVTLQVGTGTTIFESIRMLTKSSPRKINSSHLRILVIGEKMAREGISKVLDILSRDHELRSDFNILIAKDATANDILQVLTPLEKIPANKMYSSLISSAKNWGVTTDVDLHQLIYDLVDQGKEPVLSSIHIKGNQSLAKSRDNLSSVLPPASLEYVALGVIHGDRLVGWFNTRESKGYNYALGNLRSTVVVLPCHSGGRLSIELMNTHAKIKAKVVDGQPEATINVEAEGNVGEVACKLDLTSTTTIKDMEDQLGEEIKQMILQSVAKAKSFKSDVFGFGSALHRANYKQWNRMKEEWDQAFVDLPVHVNVQAKILRTGSVVESFVERME